ncbi:DMT family transporter [Paucibacter sp. Y2R2-4]|uniref:DMT family transporter n=1 Tax=Paucibacter sp. Y2R2-4 TaxID=2893553 RepID=UPI0021E3B9C7|nr:DMT family transporter [Paucibacter sp. Y2R2-4]MCV2351384.1 DMT family transporter [Paucibacter sp. Y2R2-4]
MNEQTRASIYCALAMILVGSTVVASKLIAAGLPPFTATALRFAIALPVFLLLLRWQGTRLPRLGELSRGDCALLLCQAAAGSVGYTVLMIAGLRLALAADAGVIAGTLPAIAALFAVLVLGERLDRRLVLAVTLACLGLIVVNGSASPEHAPQLAAAPSPASAAGLGLGNLLILGAIVCEALFILLNKKLQQPQPAVVLSALMCAGGIVIALPLACFEWSSIDLSSAHLLPALLGVAYYALLPTVLGFVLWYAGSARLSSARAGLFTALLPVSALLFAAWVLGEAISGRQLLGMLCVLAAMGLMALVPQQARPDKNTASTRA